MHSDLANHLGDRKVRTLVGSCPKPGPSDGGTSAESPVFLRPSFWVRLRRLSVENTLQGGQPMVAVPSVLIE